MSRLGRLGVWLMVLGVAGGCRTITHVREIPRVDLELQDVGNRGYLAGTPPAPPELKTTRRLLNVDIELPGYMTGVPPDEPQTPQVEGRAGLEELAPPEIEMEQPEEVPASWAHPETYETYTVQQDDSLWSISAKPEIYGRATQWRRIFDANRDVLRTPGDLHPKMTLRIPRTEPAQPDVEGTTVTK